MAGQNHRFWSYIRKGFWIAGCTLESNLFCEYPPPPGVDGCCSSCLPLLKEAFWIAMATCKNLVPYGISTIVKNKKTRINRRQCFIVHILIAPSKHNTTSSVSVYKEYVNISKQDVNEGFKNMFPTMWNPLTKIELNQGSNHCQIINNN